MYIVIYFSSTFVYIYAKKISLKIEKGSEVNTQYNDQQTKRTNTDLQNITQKTEDRITRTPLIPG
jgi:uncharacterized ion transporter superfamily protein YfcC